MIDHVVTLKTPTPFGSPDPESVTRLDARLAEALERYCAGDQESANAARAWLAFERGLLANTSASPGALLALADAVAEVRPAECHLASPAAAFLTFRLLGLSSLPPIRVEVPSEGLPPLLAPLPDVPWGCGLLPFRPYVRFIVRPGVPWLPDMLCRLDAAEGGMTGWPVTFQEDERAADAPPLPCEGMTLAADAAAAPSLMARAYELAQAHFAKLAADGASPREPIFYEENTARLLRDLPGIPLATAMHFAEKGRGWNRSGDREDLFRLWTRHREPLRVDAIGEPPQVSFAKWFGKLRDPMLYAWPLWHFLEEAAAERRRGKDSSTR